MNADRLLAHFERISDAPDAVDRLRRFILDLAVRGKLVEQDPGDEPADVLLDRIALTKAESSSRSKTRTTAETEADPYPLPPSWAWTQIAELGRLSPRNEADNSAVCSFVPMSLISAAYGVEASHQERPWGEIKKGYTHIAEGDVAVAKITPCFENGKSTVFRNLTGGIGAGTTELHVVRPIETSPDYIVLFLKSPFFIETGIPLMTGTAGQKRLPGDYFAYRPFPLPPLAEQHRIVEKVDELMMLCDRLEASQAEREGRRDRLVMASLNRLSQPTDPNEFKKDARFQLSNLNRLSTKPEHIKKIRKAILNLAVRGKLVPQDEREGTAETLLTQITAQLPPKKDSDEKQQDDAARWPIPPAWEWTRMKCLCSRVTSGATPSKDFFHESSGVPFLKVYNIRNQQIDFGYKPQFISRAYHETKMKRSTLQPGDVVMNIVGPPLGKVAIIPDDYPEWNCNQAIAVFKLVLPELAPYAYWFLRENSFLAEIDLIGTAGQDNISVTKSQNIPIPLPPLGEQKRIVAKVDELMLICDQLENQLEYQQKGRRQLLEALLHEALEGAG